MLIIIESIKIWFQEFQQDKNDFLEFFPIEKMNKKYNSRHKLTKSQNISPTQSPNKINPVNLKPLLNKITLADKQIIIQPSNISILKPDQTLKKSRSINKNELPELIVPYVKSYERKKKTNTNYLKYENKLQKSQIHKKFNLFSNKFQPNRPSFFNYKQKGLKNLQKQYQADILTRQKNIMSQKQNKKILQLRRKIKQITTKQLKINKIDLGSILSSSNLNNLKKQTKKHDYQNRTSQIMQYQRIKYQNQSIEQQQQGINSYERDYKQVVQDNQSNIKGVLCNHNSHVLYY